MSYRGALYIRVKYVKMCLRESCTVQVVASHFVSQLTSLFVENTLTSLGVRKSSELRWSLFS